MADLKMLESARGKELIAELKKLTGADEISVMSGEKNVTKGIVKEEVRQVESSNGIVVEKADTGKGFQIYADYKRDTSGKLKRLVR